MSKGWFEFNCWVKKVAKDMIEAPGALRLAPKPAKVTFWKRGTNPSQPKQLTLMKDGETNGRDT